MGGAIAIRSASSFPGQISQLIILDVVEGTALESLPTMTRMLATFPKVFNHPSEAIQWQLSSKQIRNQISATVSVPAQLVKKGDTYVWRTDLYHTTKFWKGWFENISKQFLSTPVPKLLILADTNRLDKDLTIAQMQGKYQMEVIANVGHCLQEDDPEKTSQCIIQFLHRHGQLK